MLDLFKKKPKKEPVGREPINYLIRDLSKKDIDTEVWDRKVITKNCGRAYLELFKDPLIEAKWKRYLFIFREKEERSAWYSIDLDRIVVNLACSLRKDELQKAVKEAQMLPEIEELEIQKSP